MESPPIAVKIALACAGLALFVVALASARLLHRRLTPYRSSFLPEGLGLFASAFLAVFLLRPLLSLVLPEVAEGQKSNVVTSLFYMTWVQLGVIGLCVLFLGVTKRLDGLRRLGLTAGRPLTLLGFGFFSYIVFYPVYVLCCYLNAVLFGYEAQRIIKEMVENPDRKSVV